MSYTDCSVWVAASTHHHKEGLAISNLKRQGFRAYCPMIRKRIKHSRRLKEVLRPLFPGYVFIKLDTELNQWRPILSTIGVRTLIRFGDKLGALPAAFVDSLLSQEQDGAIPLPKAQETYEVGKTVRMRDGPFEGLIVTVLRCEKKDRITILMDMLNRRVSATVALESVTPAQTLPGP